MTLIDWIKANAKEGTNFAEAENLIEAGNPVHGIDSMEKALEFIQSAPFFKSALDSETSKRIENSLKRYESDKLPSKLKEHEEKLRRELSPQETPEQIRIRELEEKISQSDKREMENQLKAELRAKAKDIGMDPIKADRYAVYGENAEKFMREDYQEIDNTIKTKLDAEIKSKFGNTAPQVTAPEADGKTVLTKDQFAAMSPQDKMDFSTSGGKLVNE